LCFRLVTSPPVWTRGRPCSVPAPAFSISGTETGAGKADFAVFKTGNIEIGLTSLPWVDEPLVFPQADDIEETRRELIEAGATPLGEIADGSLAELGSAPVTNGDSATGIVDVPGLGWQRSSWQTAIDSACARLRPLPGNRARAIVNGPTLLQSSVAGDAAAVSWPDASRPR
jgi:hypothetical protein